MFDIHFSMYGLFIAITLMICSFVYKWIIKVNVKHKYQEIKLEKNVNAVKLAKEYASINGHKIFWILVDDNFWNFKIKNSKQLQMQISKKSFSSNSLYDIVECLFATILLIDLKTKNKKNVDYKQKIFISINALLLLIFLTFNILIGIIICITFIIITFIWEIIFWHFNMKKAYEQTQWLISQITSLSKIKIQKCLKWKKIFVLEKYLEVFSEIFISTFILFKKWGNYE